MDSTLDLPSPKMSWSLYSERPICVVVTLGGDEYRYLAIAAFERVKDGRAVWVDHAWETAGRHPLHATDCRPIWDAPWRCWRAGNVVFYQVEDNVFDGRTRQSVLESLATRPMLETLARRGISEYDQLRLEVSHEFGEIRRGRGDYSKTYSEG